MTSASIFVNELQEFALFKLQNESDSSRTVACVALLIFPVANQPKYFKAHRLCAHIKAGIRGGSRFDGQFSIYGKF